MDEWSKIFQNLQKTGNFDEIVENAAAAQAAVETAPAESALHLVSAPPR